MSRRVLAVLLALGACASVLGDDAGAASSAAAPVSDAPETDSSVDAAADLGAEDDSSEDEPPSLLPSPPPPPAASPPMPPMPASRMGASKAAPSSPRAAKMQWVVTNAMKAKMRTLGYSSEDIDSLHPERAAAIVDRSIRRPSKGVPAAWTRKGGGPIGNLGKQIIPLLSGLTTVAAVILLGINKGKALESISGLFGQSPFGQSPRRAAAAPILTDPLTVDEPEAELWLDRQYDRLVASLAKMVGR